MMQLQKSPNLQANKTTSTKNPKLFNKQNMMKKPIFRTFEKKKKKNFDMKKSYNQESIRKTTTSEKRRTSN